MSAGAITLDDITLADWSLCLDASSAPQTYGSGIGEVVQGVADVNQCLAIILGTPPGSDPLRPTFACNLWQWIDAPLSVARPNLVREIVEAVTRWEPRIRLISVQVDLVAGSLSNLLIKIVWALRIDYGAGQQQLTLTLPGNLT